MRECVFALSIYIYIWFNLHFLFYTVGIFGTYCTCLPPIKWLGLIHGATLLMMMIFCMYVHVWIHVWKEYIYMKIYIYIYIHAYASTCRHGFQCNQDLVHHQPLGHSSAAEKSQMGMDRGYTLGKRQPSQWPGTHEIKLKHTPTHPRTYVYIHIQLYLHSKFT